MKLGRRRGNDFCMPDQYGFLISWRRCQIVAMFFSIFPMFVFSDIKGSLSLSLYSLIQSQTLRILHFLLRIFDEFFSGFRAKFQKIVTCVAFSIKFAKTNQKFAKNSEFCEKNSLLFKIIHFTPYRRGWGASRASKASSSSRDRKAMQTSTREVVANIWAICQNLTRFCTQKTAKPNFLTTKPMEWKDRQGRPRRHPPTRSKLQGPQEPQVWGKAPRNETQPEGI